MRLKDENKKLLLLENFTKAIGHEGMLAGQFLDLAAEDPKLKLTSKKLGIIQEKKTGLLIAFCCYVGGILGNVKKQELSILFEFGLILGTIFQITDDLLDKEGNQKIVGKKVNKDDKQNKPTIIRLKGINFAKKELKKNALRAKEKLSKLNKDTRNLHLLVDYICYRSN